jgi:uncharacterized protein YlxW (UPF0749 family)
MVAIPILSAAWWAAKVLGAKAAVSRFLNGSAAAALAITVAGVLAGLLFAWGVHVIRSGEAAQWQAKISQSQLLGQVRARLRDRRVEEAAARERALYVDQIETMAEHAAALERELAALRAAAGNPVIYPQSIVKELRK